MPIREHRVAPDSSCDCCDSVTRKCTGLADTEHESGLIYLARWSPGHPERGMAFLVCLGDDYGFASVMYRFEQESFMVLDPGDYDWSSKVSVLPRDQIIGTPFAAQTFRVLDEIWLHDPAVKAWVAEVESSANRKQSLAGRFLRLLGVRR